VYEHVCLYAVFFHGSDQLEFCLALGDLAGSKLLLTILGANASQKLAHRHAELVGVWLLASLTVVMGAWHRYKNNRDSSEEDVNDNVDNHSEQHAK